MKKLIALIAALSCAALTSAYAAEPTIVINGEVAEFDTAPYIKDDFTLVPFRGIFEKLGAQVGWEPAEQTVIAAKDSTIILLQIGNDRAFVNGVENKLDVAAEVTNDRTMVPLRFISEALNAKVDWDPQTSTVTITQ